MNFWGPFCFPMCWLISLIRFLSIHGIYPPCGIRMMALLWKPGLLFWSFASGQILGQSFGLRRSVNFTGLLATNFLWTFLQRSTNLLIHGLDLLGLLVWGPDDFYDSCFVSKVDYTLHLHSLLSTLEDPQSELRLLCSCFYKISHLL